MPEGNEPREGEASLVSVSDELIVRIESLLPGAGGVNATSRAIMAAARAHATELAGESPGPHHARLAAIVFLADSLTGLAVERGIDRDEARVLLERAAACLELPLDYVDAVVFLRSIRNPRLLSLPTRLTVELQLKLLVALTAVDSASLWTRDGARRLRCLIHVGGAPTRRMRAAAKLALGRSAVMERGSRALVHAVPVSRWEQPFAALAIRTRAERGARSTAFAAETAGAVGVALERETLLERSMARERSIVEAGERRFVRLGFDIHDGPIQDVSALAGDLHLFKRQLAGVLPQGEYEPLLGRVDDLQARLEEVDRELRELAQSLEAPTILRRPLEDVLRREVESFAVSSEVKARLDLTGNFAELTASQRIALVRVVQEALTNIREHSGATSVEISVAVRPGYAQATITDDGRGFDVEKALVRAARGGRLGLVGMSERIRLLGGTFDLQSRIGGPTTISATLPEWRPLATDEAAERA